MPRMNTQREGRQGDDDAGSGGCVLLYDAARGTVLLTRRSRVPVRAAGDGNDRFLEVAGITFAAGDPDPERKLDPDPESTIRRQAEAATGVRVGELKHVLDAYVGPGDATGWLRFYAAEYDGPPEGTGTAALELSFPDAMAAIRSGEIADARTILLLHWAALDGPFAGFSAGPGGGGARIAAVHTSAEGEQVTDHVPVAGELPETD
jgi:hypothetical protein